MKYCYKSFDSSAHESWCAESPAWAFLGWQSLQQHQSPAPESQSLGPLPRHIWFWIFWVFHIVYHTVYVFLYAILPCVGIFSQFVRIHMFPSQRQGIEGSARGILEINPLWQTEKGDVVLLSFRDTLGGVMEIQKSPVLLVPLQLSACLSLLQINKGVFRTRRPLPL